MKLASFIRIIGVFAFATTILGGCGGGNGPGSTSTTPAPTPTPPPLPAPTPTPAPLPAPEPAPVVVPIAPADGVYNGVTDSNRSVTAIILADNSYYFIYSKLGDPSALDGVTFGSGTLSNGVFSSDNLKDVNLSGTVSSGTLSANYDSKKIFNGSLSYLNKPVVAFSSTYESAYSSPPPLTGLAGVYSGALAADGVSETGITLTITADGTMTGTISCGCKVAAIITPLASGNGYGVRLTFNGGDHPLHDQTFTGSAYFDTGAKRLLVAGLLDATKAPAIFVGSRL